jgi:hypothetical protein
LSAGVVLREWCRRIVAGGVQVSPPLVRFLEEPLAGATVEGELHAWLIVSCRRLRGVVGQRKPDNVASEPNAGSVL